MSKDGRSSLLATKDIGELSSGEVSTHAAERRNIGGGSNAGTAGPNG